jgi:hydroxyacylglutathione hydrolase
MQLQVVPVTPFQQNCSVIWCARTRVAAIVDPGGDLDTVLGVVAANKLELHKILLTHGHIDHAGATGELARRNGLPIEGPHPGDRFWIEALADQARLFAFQPAEPFEPTRWHVRFLPGHGPLSSFGAERRTNPFVGDHLFTRRIQERGA